jgi:hypothetical protein
MACGWTVRVASPEPAVECSRQPEPVKGAFGVTRDRLRRPLTQPVCRMVRQLSGSGEGPGPGRGAAGLPEAGREMAARDQGVTQSSAGRPRRWGQGQPLTAATGSSA